MPAKRPLVLLLLVAATVVSLGHAATAGPRLHVDVSITCIVISTGGRRAGESDDAHRRVAEWLATEAGSRLPSAHPGWSTGCDEHQTSATRLELRVGGSSAGRLPDAPGSFLLDFHQAEASATLRLLAADTEGLLSGAGRLLRELHMPARVEQQLQQQPTANHSGSITVPAGLHVRHDAAKALWRVRGHQISVNTHPLQLRTDSAFRRFAGDLKAFGTNQLEMAHLGAVTTPSVLSGMVEFSSACAAVGGINVSVWDGALLTALIANRSAVAEVFQAMPKLDSVFFPGGDGGQLLWPAIQDTSKLLRQYHSGGGVWVSAQELSSDGMEAFWRNVSASTKVGLLSGVVYGPHVRVPLTEYVRRATIAGAAVRQYPDITHTLSDQFPLPHWHAAWSLTHGRQTVCPLPKWSEHIIRLRGNGSTPVRARHTTMRSYYSVKTDPK
jgi:hypothetical protein